MGAGLRSVGAGHAMGVCGEGRGLKPGGGAYVTGAGLGAPGAALTLALIGRSRVSDGLVALWGLRGGVRLRRSEERDEGMPGEHSHRARLHIGPHCRWR